MQEITAVVGSALALTLEKTLMSPSEVEAVTIIKDALFIVVHLNILLLETVLAMVEMRAFFSMMVRIKKLVTVHVMVHMSANV